MIVLHPCFWGLVPFKNQGIFTEKIAHVVGMILNNAKYIQPIKYQRFLVI